MAQDERPSEVARRNCARVTCELSAGTCTHPNDYALQISAFLCVSHLILLWFLLRRTESGWVLTLESGQCGLRHSASVVPGHPSMSGIETHDLTHTFIWLMTIKLSLGGGCEVEIST